MGRTQIKINKQIAGLVSYIRKLRLRILSSVFIVRTVCA